MAIQAPTIDADLEAVKAALAGVQPRPGRVLLIGSRARGDARPDSDNDFMHAAFAYAQRLDRGRGSTCMIFTLQIGPTENDCKEFIPGGGLPLGSEGPFERNGSPPWWGERQC